MKFAEEGNTLITNEEKVAMKLNDYLSNVVIASATRRRRGIKIPLCLSVPPRKNLIL